MQGIASITGMQDTGHQQGPQGRSPLVLPLSSSLLAQVGTSTSHVLHTDSGSASDHDVASRNTSADRIETQLNEGSDELTPQGATIINPLFVTGAIDTDQNTRPSQEPAQPPRADRTYSARNVLNDAAITVLELPGDIEPAGDIIVANGNTQTQPAGVGVSFSPQSQIPSEPRNFHADTHADGAAEASQPQIVPQGSELLETEAHRAATPTKLTGNDICEPGLQDIVTKLEASAPPIDNNSNSLRSVFFKLYLDEEADPLEPQCCVKLTGLTSRDELFIMMHDDLQDDLDTGDQIAAVKVKRADGEVFRGPNVRTMPIKRVGRQDMWRELTDTLLEHGVGEEGLRGYVKVKKCIDAK